MELADRVELNELLLRRLLFGLAKTNQPLIAKLQEVFAYSMGNTSDPRRAILEELGMEILQTYLDAD